MTPRTALALVMLMVVGIAGVVAIHNVPLQSNEPMAYHGRVRERSSLLQVKEDAANRDDDDESDLEERKAEAVRIGKECVKCFGGHKGPRVGFCPMAELSNMCFPSVPAGIDFKTDKTKCGVGWVSSVEKCGLKCAECLGKTPPKDSYNGYCGGTDNRCYELRDEKDGTRKYHGRIKWNAFTCDPNFLALKDDFSQCAIIPDAELSDTPIIPLSNKDNAQNMEQVMEQISGNIKDSWTQLGKNFASFRTKIKEKLSNGVKKAWSFFVRITSWETYERMMHAKANALQLTSEYKKAHVVSIYKAMDAAYPMELYTNNAEIFEDLTPAQRMKAIFEKHSSLRFEKTAARTLLAIGFLILREISPTFTAELAETRTKKLLTFASAGAMKAFEEVLKSRKDFSDNALQTEVEDIKETKEKKQNKKENEKQNKKTQQLIVKTKKTITELETRINVLKAKQTNKSIKEKEKTELAKKEELLKEAQKQLEELEQKPVEDDETSEVERLLKEWKSIPKADRELIDEFLSIFLGVSLQVGNRHYKSNYPDFRSAGKRALELGQIAIDTNFRILVGKMRTRLKGSDQKTKLCEQIATGVQYLKQQLADNIDKDSQRTERIGTILNVASTLATTAFKTAAQVTGFSTGDPGTAMGAIQGASGDLFNTAGTFVTQVASGAMKYKDAKKALNRKLRMALLDIGHLMVSQLTEDKQIVPYTDKATCYVKSTNALKAWYEMAYADVPGRDKAIKVVMQFDDKMKELRVDYLRATEEFFKSIYQAVLDGVQSTGKAFKKGDEDDDDNSSEESSSSEEEANE